MRASPAARRCGGRGRPDARPGRATPIGGPMDGTPGVAIRRGRDYVYLPQGETSRIQAVAKVEIYTSPFCGFCSRAKRPIDGKGVDYTEICVLTGSARTSTRLNSIQ